MKEHVTPDDVVNLLNKLLEIDPGAMNEFVERRIRCNKNIGDDTHVQVLSENGKDYVGLIGILNGLFGVHADGNGPIGSMYGYVCASSCDADPEKPIVAGGKCPECGGDVKVGKIVKFVVYKDWKKSESCSHCPSCKGKDTRVQRLGDRYIIRKELADEISKAIEIEKDKQGLS
jgi:hypothetical protein